MWRKLVKYVNNIFNEDCISGMKKIRAGVVDLIVTDPPFAIDFKTKRANYNRKQSNVIEGYSDIKPEDYESFTDRWIDQAKRILKGYGSMYVISGYNHLGTILNSLEKHQFHLQNHIIWKFQFGVRTKRKYVASHYHILFVTKDKAKYKFFPNSRYQDDERTDTNGSARYQDMEDVWNIQREYWTNEKKTPTKLPSALIEKILDYSSKKNDLIADPFLGSGQVAVVAKRMKRRYVGFEIVKEYFDFAKSRLKAVR